MADHLHRNAHPWLLSPSGNPNTYPWLGYNPYKNTDPSGLCLEDLCIGEGIVATEAVEALSAGVAEVAEALAETEAAQTAAETAAARQAAEDAATIARQLANLKAPGAGPTPGEQCTASQPTGIPENWQTKPTRTSGGVKYYDPFNPGNSVRIMPGNPNSPYPNSQAPYVRWQVNGQPLDAQGNVLPSGETPEAHIPLQSFRFNPDVYK